PTVEQAALAADALAAEPGEPLTLATPTSVPVPPSTLDERPQLAVGAALAAENQQATTLAEAVTQVSERASLLVREEIELAKAEMAVKARKLATGAVVGIVAGVFVLTGLFFLLNSAAWGAYLIFGGTAYWAGFLLVAVALFVLGAI